MRTTLDLPDDLFRLAKAKAALEGKTLRSLIIRFIEEGLARRSAGPPARRQRSPLPAFPPLGAKIPTLSNAEIGQVLEGEDVNRELRTWSR